MYKFAPEILDTHMTAHASTTSVWIFMKHEAYTLYGRRRRHVGVGLWVKYTLIMNTSITSTQKSYNIIVCVLPS